MPTSSGERNPARQCLLNRATGRTAGAGAEAYVRVLPARQSYFVPSVRRAISNFGGSIAHSSAEKSLTP